MADLYTPAPVQQEFHICTANEILLGGAAGPGKSLALLMDPIQTQLIGEHQRWQRGEIVESAGWALHLRREFPRLEQTIERAHRLFRQFDSGARWEAANQRYTFSCGYKVQFGHVRTKNSWPLSEKQNPMIDSRLVWLFKSRHTGG